MFWSNGETIESLGLQEATDFSVKVRASSQVIMGRFWRSLKVGRMTEYRALVDDFLVGAIAKE